MVPVTYEALGDASQTCIVDQSVERSHLGLDFIEHAPDVALLADVRLDHVGFAPQGADRLRDGSYRLLVA